ncbi:MAG: hypothetical protein GY717_13915 [Rhodobacteraceae bacterium]|nr:hypothetical protein [Paracoccaceae bacterium]
MSDLSAWQLLARYRLEEQSNVTHSCASCTIFVSRDTHGTSPGPVLNTSSPTP